MAKYTSERGRNGKRPEPLTPLVSSQCEGRHGDRA